MYSFFVDGKPQGKARPRFSRGRAYTPKTTADYEKHIAECYNGDKFSDALFVDIKAYFGVPKSYTKKQIKAIENGGYPLKKPDADNICKVVLDALNGVAYEDDKQVVDCRIVKQYSFVKEGLEITIGEVDV